MEYWFGIGFITFIIALIHDVYFTNSDVTIKQLMQGLLIIPFGPLSVLGILYLEYGDVVIKKGNK